eukprot:scaffold12986_cov68-Cyclotella_meneghiniana.AAC.2
MEFKCVNLEENIHSKSRQVKCERCTDSSSSAHISSTNELTDAIEIELTWHRHLEPRNELYELEMGPFDILDVYLSGQKTVRSSMTKDELTELMHWTDGRLRLRHRHSAYYNKKKSDDKTKIRDMTYIVPSELMWLPHTTCHLVRWQGKMILSGI